MNAANLLNLVNADAEMTILSAMRLNPATAVELAQALEPEDFYDPRRALVFEAMRHVLRGIEPLEDEAILAAAQGLQRERKHPLYIAPDYLDTFCDGDLARALPYAHSVKRLAWLRGAGEFATWLVEELQIRPDPDDLFAAAQERWQMLQPKTAQSRFVYGWETLQQHAEQMRQRAEEKRRGELRVFDWPWASWNAKNRVRPLRPGFVGVIAAPDGQGKSTYLEMISEHWAARGRQVVYVHLEDELSYKRDRRAARNALISLDKIEDENLTSDEHQRLADANRRMSEWAGNLHYLDAAGESMVRIVRELESRVAEGVCEAVVFDYLDKVQPSPGQATFFGGNAWERQANDMEQLKTFAERNKVPVLTATQGNKSMQDGGVQTRQAIQGTGQKSQKSQLVVILTRDLIGEHGLHDKNGRLIAEPGEYSPVVKVRIDKQNLGKTCGFQQYIKGEFFIVGDINGGTA